MSSRGDLLSTALAVGSLSGLFLYKQRIRQQGLFGQQATRKAQEGYNEDDRVDTSSSLQWNRHRWDSVVEVFARRLIQSQKLNIDWPLLVVDGDVQDDNEDVGSDDESPQRVQIHTKANNTENIFQLLPQKIVCNSLMMNSPLKTVEEKEEENESEEITNSHLDAEPASSPPPVVNRMIPTVKAKELIKMPQKATPRTPKTPDSTTSSSSQFVSDDDKSVVLSSRKAQRRTIFGARVTKKYVRQPNVDVPISSF